MDSIKYTLKDDDENKIEENATKQIEYITEKKIIGCCDSCREVFYAGNKDKDRFMFVVQPGDKLGKIIKDLGMFNIELCNDKECKKKCLKECPGLSGASLVRVNNDKPSLLTKEKIKKLLEFSIWNPWVPFCSSLYVLNCIIELKSKDSNALTCFNRWFLNDLDTYQMIKFNDNK